MKKFIAIALSAMLLCFSFAFAETATAPVPNVTVTFTENPTTGYTWSFSSSDEAILTIADNGFVAGPDADKVEGAGGTHTWTITGKAEGDATATFTFGQGWEGGEIADTIVYSFHVDADKNLTQTAISGYPDLYASGKGAIVLTENPTTGYQWKYKASTEGILTVEKDEFVAPTTDAMGAGGVHVWVFTGAKEGDVTLTFEYARSWEEGVMPDATITYVFHVDASLNVTQTSVDGDFAAYNPLAPKEAE